MVQKPSQIVGQGHRRLVALLRFLLQTFQADRLEVGCDFRLQRPHRHRVAMPDLLQGVVDRASFERWAAGEKFVKECSERMDISGGREVLGGTKCLLRRHVCRSPHDATVLGPCAVVVDAFVVRSR